MTFQQEVDAINTALLSLMMLHKSMAPGNEAARVADAINHLATARELLGGEHQEEGA